MMRLKNWKYPLLVFVWAVCSLVFCTSSFGKLLQEFVNVQSHPPRPGVLETGYNQFPGQPEQLAPEQERIANRIATASGWGALSSVMGDGWR
jgi:hypothetical protein